MSYTLGEAAKAVGKSKTTLHRAIKSGKISAHRVPNGSYSIDPSELHRVFPVVLPVTGTRPLLRNDSEQQINTIETLRIQLELQEKERQRERALLQETIADLREDRDRWRAQATGLLSDLRTAQEKVAPAASPEVLPQPRPKGFWKRLFG